MEAPPEGMSLTVGDYMPEMWDIIPANERAMRVASAEQFEGDYHLDDEFEREFESNQQ